MCDNPFFKCNNKSVFILILYKGELHEICEECWIKINEEDIEW